MADETPDSGSILVRRGPTSDREGFTPLTGEVIYDTDTDQLFIGDSTTAGGKPAFGDKIKVDREGNLTELLLQGTQNRPAASSGLFRYNPATQSLEYSDGADYYLVASTPFNTSTNVLYVSPNGRDDNLFGIKRGRTPGTAFASLNAACREAERVINRASKGLGPYQKWITYDSAVEQKRSYITDISDVDDFKSINVFKGASELDATTELRSGFRVIGQTSGAVGIIEEYNVNQGSTKDTLIINVEAGEFELNEQLKFGNPIPGVPYSEYKAAGTEYPEITIRIESGVYFEHFPIKVPNNTSIKGDEFRRSIIRPRPGSSASPYANIRFKRGAEHLGLDPAVVGDNPFGAHYLADRNNSIYDYSDNPGDYDEAYKTLSTMETKASLQDSVIEFITTTYPTLDYDEEKCRRDVGYIVDAVALDMLYGGYQETLFAALTYQGQLPSNQVTETAAAINHLKIQMSALVESAEQSVVEDLVGSVVEVINGNFNAPKDNDEMDVFLMNDATIIRNISVQGHGGFMEVLDPEGQILTKSPYTQTASSFSKSIAPDVLFGGGMFIDGFAGNLDARLKQVNSTTEIVIDNVYRQPQTPTSFFIEGTRFQIDKADTVGVNEGEYRLLLNPATPWELSYYQIVNETATALPTVPYDIEILSAGNISMLGNDFTQVNDLGYGVYTTNNARCELVSVFCYYNHISYLAENGSDIRSLNGSTAYGDYALVAKGSDPLEVSDQVFVAEDLVQVATITTTGDYPNQRGDTVIYVINPDYAPFNVSEIEVDHLGVVSPISGDPVYLNRYEVTNVTAIDGTSPQVYALNIAQGAADNPGIQIDIPDGTQVIIRSNQVVKFDGIIDVNPTRPSTALVYDDDPEKVYRVLSYDVAGLPSDEARITLRESYDYVKLVIDDTAGSVAGSGQVGDTTIRLDVDLDANEAGRIQGAIDDSLPYIFGFNGTIHTVTAYRDKATTGQLYAEIDISPALTKSFASYPDAPTMRAGVQQGTVARITVGISTLRVTGHDMLDIGTGSYQTSSYPREIYGQPEIPASQPREVVEEGKGRVFYVTTDQDGNFRVGEFFKVDQGTGTVTFSASIALSNLDGIGFKRGVAVSEFSTDDAMTDNASDTVPTESAVRSYVNRRLGLTHAGQVVPAKIGPGYLDLTGTQPMAGNLDLATNRIERVGTPTQDDDAATKKYAEDYADAKTFEVNGRSANVDNAITLITDDILEPVSNPTNLWYTDARARAAISVTDSGGDGSLTYDNTTGVISYTGPSATEVRAHFSATANNAGDGVSRYGDLSYDSATGEFAYTGISVDEIRGVFSVTGSISYDAATGQISFSEKTDQDIRDLFSASGDLAYNSNTGVFTLNKFTTSDARSSVTAQVTADTETEEYYGNLTYASGTGIFRLTGTSRTEIREAINVSGDLSYDSATGTLSYDRTSDATIRGLFAAGGDLSYDDSTGTFSFTQASIGSGDVRSNVSGNDAGGLGSFTYTQSTGVFEYTGPSNADVRALFSNGGDLSYNETTGQFSVTVPADTGDLTNEAGYIKLTDLSATGDLSYDDQSGQFSFTAAAQRTDSDIRNLFSNSGDLSYNSISGQFSISKTKIGLSGQEAKGTVTLTNSGATTITQTGNTIDIGSEDTTYSISVANEAGDDTADQTRVRLNDGSTDQDVIIKAGNAINVSGNASTDVITISHEDTSTQDSVDNSNGNVIQDVTLDTFGHVTGLTSVDLDDRYAQNSFTTITVDDTDTEYTWTETGSASADTKTDTLTLVSGSDINLDIDATNDAIRVGLSHPTAIAPLGNNIGSFTRSGVSVTVTADEPHGLTTSDSINILTPSDNFNGTFSIQQINSTTQFTYVDSGAAVTEADIAFAKEGTFDDSIALVADGQDLYARSINVAVVNGVWNGVTIDETRGGTGQNSFAAGDILYASAANTLSKLAKGTDGQVLKLSGGVPSWGTDNNTTYTSSDFDHDSLTGFVANEHIDWTVDQGSTNIHSGNYTNTTYNTFTNTVDGLVPNPGEAGSTKFLRQDGTWVVPTDNNDDTITSVGISGSETTGTVTFEGGGTVSITQSGSTVTVTGSSAASSTSITDSGSSPSQTVWYPTFVAGTGDQGVKIHDSTDTLKYIPSSGTLTATTFSGNATSANYADLAEMYTTDVEYEPGTVVEFGGEAELTQTTRYASIKVAGVISTMPAYLMNAKAKGQPLALKGRVPCKVVGPVTKGDLLVASDVPGVAIAVQEFIGGAMIGKAIETNTSQEVKTVEIFVGVM